MASPQRVVVCLSSYAAGEYLLVEEEIVGKRMWLVALEVMLQGPH